MFLFKLLIWIAFKYGWSWKFSPDCSGYAAWSARLWSVSLL